MPRVAPIQSRPQADLSAGYSNFAQFPLPIRVAAGGAAAVAAIIALGHEGAFDFLLRSIGEAAKGSGYSGPSGAVGPIGGASQGSGIDRGSPSAADRDLNDAERQAAEKIIDMSRDFVQKHSPSQNVETLKRVESARDQTLPFVSELFQEIGERVKDALNTGRIPPDHTAAGANDLNKTQRALFPKRW